jgi:ADP-dependent phosphofructokinase/glucokinase
VTEEHLIWMAPKHFEPVKGQRLELSPNNPNPIWTVETDDSTYKFTLVPLMVCSQIKKTVGLGDTVSATGLAYSF